MNGAVQRVLAVARLELLTQRREPLTGLYALVLGLLAAAFAAAGPVELVRGRGAVPRDASWSLMLASTALTAFGQIITTMVAATVVLRDRQDRVDELLTVSMLTPRQYLTGKLLAALAMLAMIYAAIPLGLVMGAVGAGGRPAAALANSLLPFLTLVLPTMLAIGALQFGIGVLSGRLWIIVGQGLLLIWCWSWVVDAISGAGASPWLPLLDPFGSAPVVRATENWTDAERAAREVSITGMSVGARLVWLALGGSVALAALLRAPRRPVFALRRSSHARVEEAAPAWGDARRALISCSQPPPWWLGARATASYVLRWMLRDTGWRVLTVLGSLNVGIHALLDARGAAAAADLSAVAERALSMHSRLFLILLATIYAGELVWREREERSAPMFDVMPVSDSAVLLGRVAGVMIAQCAVVTALTVIACAGVWLGAGRPPDGVHVAAVAITVIGMDFIVWMLVALAVHVVLQQKVAAHLVCIAAWVVGAIFLGAAEAGERSAPVWLSGAAGVAALVVARVGWVRREAIPR